MKKKEKDMTTDITPRDGLTLADLTFINNNGEFRELGALINVFGERLVKSANIPLLKSFGCTEEACLLDHTKQTLKRHRGSHK